MDKQEIMQAQAEAFSNGKVLYNTCEGTTQASIVDLVNQPTEGLLYDLNRDIATVATIFDEQMLLNEVAIVNTLRYLHHLLTSDDCCCGGCKHFDYELPDGTGMCRLNQDGAYCGMVCVKFEKEENNNSKTQDNESKD